MDRMQWLEERRKGLGSSDAAAVCGLSPWRTPLAVYADKLGLLPDEQNEAMAWGLTLELVVAQAWEERKGDHLLMPMPIRQHPKHPWMLASLDRVGSDRIVELKTARTDEGWGHEGTDEIPEQYIVQVQHQMAVTGIDLADVAVLIAGQEFRVYTVPANQALQQRLVEIEGAFWEHVLDHIPPEPDWTHPDTPKLMELIHRPEEGKTIDLDDSAYWRVDKYVTLGEAIREYERLRGQAKAELIAAMGDASIGRLPDGRTITRKPVTRKSYTVDECTYIDFRIKQPKKARDE